MTWWLGIIKMTKYVNYCFHVNIVIYIDHKEHTKIVLMAWWL